MKALDEFKVPMPGAILWNPIFSPTEHLIARINKRRIFKVTPTFYKHECGIAQFQSGLKTVWFYDFFWEESLWNLSLVWIGYKDALLRILPEGDSFEEIENFRDGTSGLEEAIDMWFIEKLPFSAAIMNVVDIVVEWATDDTELFDNLITEQIEKVASIVEDEWLSDRNVLQLTQKWEGNIWVFPRDFFHDNDEWGKIDELRQWIKWLFWWILPWWQAVPV